MLEIVEVQTRFRLRRLFTTAAPPPTASSKPRMLSGTTAFEAVFRGLLAFAGVKPWFDTALPPVRNVAVPTPERPTTMTRCGPGRRLSAGTVRLTVPELSATSLLTTGRPFVPVTTTVTLSPVLKPVAVMVMLTPGTEELMLTVIPPAP